MNEEKHFLEAISASEPNADLIYADWLEEQGRPEADEIREPAFVVLPRWSQNRSRNRSRNWSRPYSWSRSNYQLRYQSRSRSGSESQFQSFSLCYYYMSRSLSRSFTRFG